MHKNIINAMRWLKGRKIKLTPYDFGSCLLSVANINPSAHVSPLQVCIKLPQHIANGTLEI